MAVNVQIGIAVQLAQEILVSYIACESLGATSTSAESGPKPDHESILLDLPRRRFLPLHDARALIATMLLDAKRASCCPRERTSGMAPFTARFPGNQYNLALVDVTSLSEEGQ